MIQYRLLLRGLVVFISLMISGASAKDEGAQEQVYRRIVVQGGAPVRIAALPNLKADCSNGPLPEFKILKAPAHGKIIARRGRVHTGKQHRCPDTDALAQVLFYQSNPNYDGSDEISVEVTSPEGRKAVSNAQIEVRGKPVRPDGTQTDL